MLDKVPKEPRKTNKYSKTGKALTGSLYNEGMKVGIVKFLAVVLALGFMFAMPKSAEAHNAPAKFHASSPEKSAPATVKSEISLQSVAVASGSNEDDGCIDGCCSMAAACCSPAALMQNQFELVPVQAAFDFDFNMEALPQGPPYSLLRPPKFSA